MGNQGEISDHETFQLEYDSLSCCWYIRTMQDKYFALQASGGVQANETKKTASALFNLVWGEDGSVSYKANGSSKLERNKATCETILVERAEGGQVHFKG